MTLDLVHRMVLDRDSSHGWCSRAQEDSVLQARSRGDHCWMATNSCCLRFVFVVCFESSTERANNLSCLRIRRLPKLFSTMEIYLLSRDERKTLQKSCLFSFCRHVSRRCVLPALSAYQANPAPVCKKQASSPSHPPKKPRVGAL